MAIGETVRTASRSAACVAKDEEGVVVKHIGQDTFGDRSGNWDDEVCVRRTPRIGGKDQSSAFGQARVEGVESSSNASNGSG